MTIVNCRNPIPVCPDETVCCADELEGGAALDCEAYGAGKKVCGHVETWFCCTQFHPNTQTGVGPASGCDPSYPDHVMCPATLRKGKRYYDEELASGGKCGARAANFNLGQTVASIDDMNTRVLVDETATSVSTDHQTSPGVDTFGIGTGLDTDSTAPSLGVNLNIPTVGNVGGQLPSLHNPTAPAVVSQLTPDEADATNNIFSYPFTNLLSSRNIVRETPSDQISHPWADTP